MGVLIKGMTMPKSCCECKLNLRTDICKAFCEWNAENPYSIRGKDRLPDCPLVEVPEPRKGKWIGKYPVTSACSECNYLIHDSKVKVFAYCPNCGAKMEEQDAKI